MLLGVGAATGSAASKSHGSRTHRSRTDVRASATGADRMYLKTSLEGDLFEIAGGKIALAHSTNPAVLKLARTLIRDHTKSFRDGAKLARRIGEAVPRDPSPTMVWELAVISSQTSTTFDRLYSSLEVADHRQDIDESRDEIRLGTGLARADAVKNLPMLRMHLRLARQALAQSR